MPADRPSRPRSPGVASVVRASLLASLAVASLAACASGGGGGASPPPLPPVLPPPPPPPPAPPPPTNPPSFYETPEYLGSSFISGNRPGLQQIGASTAYSRGATGRGIVVAVIDSGVDTSISELQGQVTSTADVCATGCGSARGTDDIDHDGHGTMVTSIIVARKDNVGVHGVAFDARVMSIRTDTPGSCQDARPSGGCSFSDASVVNAVNYAVSHGARIINLSLGSEGTVSGAMRAALQNAASHGVLVVIAAGNEAVPPSGSDPAKGTSPSQPGNIAGDPAMQGRVTVVGAVDRNNRIATFSNRAGSSPTRDFYLLAPGVSVVTAGVDDNVRLPNNPTCAAGQTTGCNDTDDDGDYWAFSGTSAAAPHVAGALALMLDLFPNISPETALQALLMTATDYVDSALDPIRGEAAGAGIDNIGGRGILNLAAAFSPIGASSFTFANSGEEVSMQRALAPAMGATGDWIDHSRAFDGLVFQDVLKRGFRLDRASQWAARAPFADFGIRADYARGHSGAVAFGDAQLSWFNAPAPIYDPRTPWAEAPDATFQVRYAFQNTEIATGRGGGPARLTPSLMLANDPSGSPVLGSGDEWASASHAFGPVTLDLRASSGGGRAASSFGIGHTGEDWSVRLGLSTLKDERTSLGGALQSRFGGDDGAKLSAIGFEAVRMAGAWRLSGSLEAASARIAGADVAGLWTSAWSLSAERPLAVGSLRLSLAQPRRAEGGTLSFDGPVEVLKSGAIRFEPRTASLTPSGRELDLETAWSAQLSSDTTIEAAAALLLQPNHVASAEPAAAAWVSLRKSW
jgi:subtilisin family serine protease